MADLLERPVVVGTKAPSLDDESLDPIAVEALVEIFSAWRLTVPQAASLVRESERNWSRIRRDPVPGSLDTDQRTRASALVGLYEGLHVYFGAELADKWVTMPNRGPLFVGQAPLDYMRDGGIPAMLATRDYIDALGAGM